MLQQVLENRGVYERAQDFISQINRSKYIESQISKLRAAKERVYRNFAKFMLEYSKGFAEFKTKPEDAIVCYHKDTESFERINGIDKKLYKSILGGSKASELPVMVLTRENERKSFVPVLNKNSKISNDCKKVCAKLDDIISEMEKLRQESRGISIDPKEGTAILTQIDEESKRLRSEYEFEMTNLEGAKETRSVLQERCKGMKSDLQPHIQSLSKVGLSFDFIKKLTPQQIEGLSRAKPEIRNYFNHDIVQLIEESKCADDMDLSVTHLSTQVCSLGSELKRFEDASNELRHMVPDPLELK